MLLRTTKRLRQGKRGISSVIVVMLSLVILVIIVSNVILWSYQMNQFDWERMQEKVEIGGITRMSNSSWSITLENKGSVTAHLVSLWVDGPTIHMRYDMSLFIDAGATTNVSRSNGNLFDNASVVKVVTERGTVSLLKLS